MNFLTAPAASLTMPERLLIRDLATKAAQAFGPTCRMVNIGVGLGGTCWCLREGAPKALLIGLDIDPDSLRGNWIFYRADSRRFHDSIEPPVHLLLIDGDHDYYGVRADILNWTPKVPPGGLVLFHDYGNAEKAPWTAGVHEAVDELMDAATWDVAGTADSIKAFTRR